MKGTVATGAPAATMVGELRSYDAGESGHGATESVSCLNAKPHEVSRPRQCHLMMRRALRRCAGRPTTTRRQGSRRV